MGSQRVGHDWATSIKKSYNLNWHHHTVFTPSCLEIILSLTSAGSQTPAFETFGARELIRSLWRVNSDFSRAEGAGETRKETEKPQPGHLGATRSGQPPICALLWGRLGVWGRSFWTYPPWPFGPSHSGRWRWRGWGTGSPGQSSGPPPCWAVWRGPCLVSEEQGQEEVHELNVLGIGAGPLKQRGGVKEMVVSDVGDIEPELGFL